MKHALSALLMLVAFALTPGQVMADSGTLSITAGYRQRIALPPGAVLEVELLDVSRADAPSIRLSSQSFRMDHVPLSVTLHYDPAMIDDRMSYAVAARILTEGRVLFRTTANSPVITRGWPAEVSLVLQMTSRHGQVAGDVQRIAGVPWAAIEISGRVISDDDPPTITFEEDGTFALFGGCNRFRGQAELGPGRISFPMPIAGTNRACRESRMQLDRDVLEALGATVLYQRNGALLVFAGGTGQSTIRFHERPD